MAFEAAARHMSFTRGANELGVTQVAISRQIKALEDFLGVRLFERLNRSVRLTPEGGKFQQVVTGGLSQIAAAVVDFQKGRGNNHLVVGTTTAFSAYWLMPRLAKFHAAYPEIDLRFAVDDKCVDLKASGIHISIRYGNGVWGGLTSTYLCDSEVLPLCSPAYWKDRPQVDDPRMLLDEFLIDFDYVVDSRWSTWFEHFGVEVDQDPADISIDAYTSMVQAAQNGQGIALLSSPLVDDLIDNGSLIAPTSLPRQKLAGGYYIVTPKKADPCPALDIFRNWVLQEMFQGGSPVNP
ncbi:LysR substrate-binding domain-containing protein [Kiloniella laminariae]|uniref:LysR substrate-binding domain-containing protein n=1 Tax=Kiloniella laminariae TaxID=454162 RepID=A0ABT4LLT0_9PROT|nr:LysR substrate-binding domain-containing protein [Kiloniella laminariae]MCZ4280932.1 LysR substrate-binding domain-containing protein [Kiloniella laminariae]